MHPCHYTLTRHHVYRHLTHRLRQHLRLRDYGRKCSAQCLIRILAAAAAQRLSVHGICQQLHGPSDETVRQALKANLPDASELQRRLNHALAADLPAPVRKGRYDWALDLDQLPYHGQPHAHADERVRGQPKGGTTPFHVYATLAILRHGRRFTLALTWVQANESMAQVVRRLLRQAWALGLRPRRLLLDRGFFTVAVVRYLKAAHVPFGIAMPIRGRKAKPPQPAGGTRALCLGCHSYVTTYRWRDAKGRLATVNVAVVYCRKRAQQQKKPPPRARARRRRNEVPFELYAFGGWQPKSPQGVRGLYRRRFGIESEYRQVNQARMRTSTREPVVRLLYVGLALLLRNLWVWLHYAVLSGPRRGGRLFRWRCLRLAQLLVWLWQGAACYFGVRSRVDTERPPPKELQPVA